MTPTNRSYVEHVAVRVHDIHWHIRFFREVLGMGAREIDGPADDPRQYWTIGGMQLMAAPGLAAPPSNDAGRLAHLGIMVEDLEAALAAAKPWGVTELPQGRNWLQLPDGLAIELIQASGQAVAEVLAVDPRARTADEIMENAMPSIPRIEFQTPERYWDDAREGDECVSPGYVVTEARINAYAELTGDFTPVHVDEEYAKTTPFGTRVAHGLFGLSIADGLKTRSEYRFLPGMSLGWTWDFLLPIRLGDTLHVKFRVGSMRLSKSRPGWGIVVLPSELINQHGDVVHRGEHRLMIPRRPGTF